MAPPDFSSVLFERSQRRRVVCRSVGLVRCVGRSVVVGMAKKASFDGVEYDFGSQSQDREAAPAPVATSPVQASDLLNPYKYSLVRVVLRRVNPGDSFGLELISEGDHLIKVTKAGPVATEAGVPDSYLLSINGKRVKNDTDYKNAEKSSKCVLRIVCAKKRTEVIGPNAFPMPPFVKEERDRRYLLLRLNPSDGSRVGMGIREKNGVVRVALVVKNSAGHRAGVKVDDRLLAIDETPVENRDICQALVQQTVGNPFDMLVQRGDRAVAYRKWMMQNIWDSGQQRNNNMWFDHNDDGMGAPRNDRFQWSPFEYDLLWPVQSLKPTTSNDSNTSDPSAGVPKEIPRDVSLFMDDAKAKAAVQSIRNSVKKRQDKAKTPVADGSRASAKLNKDVSSVTLKKPGRS